MIAPYTSHGVSSRNRFCAYTTGGSGIRYQTLSSGNNRKRGKGNSQDSKYSAPVMLQVYFKATPQDKIAGTEPTRHTSQGDVGTEAPQREELDLHPIRMRDILQTVLQDERTGIKYGKYLDRQARRQGTGEHSHHPSRVPELEASGITHQDFNL